MKSWTRIQAELGRYAWVENGRVWPLKRLPSGSDPDGLGATSAGIEGKAGGSIMALLKKLLVGAKWPILVGYRHRGKDKWVTFDESGWIVSTSKKEQAQRFTNIKQLEAAWSWLLSYSGGRALFFEAKEVPPGSIEEHRVNQILREKP